jgi:hypothetical protein
LSRFAASSPPPEGGKAYLGNRTSMRRHCLSSRRGGPALCGMNANGLCPSRYASIRTLGEPSVLWLGAYDEIRLFEPKALQSSERSSLRVDQVHLRSRLMLDPKRYLGQQSWPSATLGRLAAVSCYLHLLFACLCSIASAFKQPPPALCADWRCRADRRPLR